MANMKEVLRWKTVVRVWHMANEKEYNESKQELEPNLMQLDVQDVNRSEKIKFRPFSCVPCYRLILILEC